MVYLRRILKAFWFSAAISIILSLAIVATSVMDKTCPVFAANPAAEADVVAKVPTIVPGPDNPRGDPGESPDFRIVCRVKADEDVDIASDNSPVKLYVPKGSLTQEAEFEIVDHGTWGNTSGLVRFLEL